MDEDQKEIIKVQRLREFGHYKAAKYFNEGKKVFPTDTKRAEELFKTVVQMEPDNAYGLIYLLFTQEDNGYPLSQLITTCNRILSLPTKKQIHGLYGISQMMMMGYLKKADAMRIG